MTEDHRDETQMPVISACKSVLAGMPGLLLFTAIGWCGLGGIALGQGADSATLGRIEGAADTIALGATATGTIAEVLVHPSDHVRAGQPLVRVECGSIERELTARKADLEAAEAALLRTIHGPRAEEIAIGVANVNLAEARSLEAQKSLQRTGQLHEGFTVTRVQIDLAQRDAHIAAAQLDEMRAKLALLKAGSRQEDIDEARARRDAAKDRVEEAAARLAYCSVDAPVGGMILTTNVVPGQLVSTTVPVTLLTMVDDSKRRVRAFVDERDVAKLCVHQRARVSADGIAGLQADGAVETIGVAVADNPFATNTARQFRQVMLSIADKEPQMPIGLRVSIAFSPCAPAPRPPGR
jgi:HlyD family secretion protein